MSDKVILIFNRPKECCECPCFDESDYCNAIGESTPLDGIRNDCLLKSLPEMIYADTETDMSGGDDYASGYRDGWSRGIEIGWNRYRKAITGEIGEEE